MDNLYKDFLTVSLDINYENDIIRFPFSDFGVAYSNIKEYSVGIMVGLDGGITWSPIKDAHCNYDSSGMILHFSSEQLGHASPSGQRNPDSYLSISNHYGIIIRLPYPRKLLVILRYRLI